MTLELNLNGVPRREEIPPDMTLLAFLRRCGCLSVKQGCHTQSCGLCTVWVDDKPLLSCSYPAARAAHRRVTTLEGVPREAAQFGAFLSALGAEQCGFCAPGFIMTVLAMKRELANPGEEEMRAYLAGNLCRCSGYSAQMQAVRAYMEADECDMR